MFEVVVREVVFVESVDEFNSPLSGQDQLRASEHLQSLLNQAGGSNMLTMGDDIRTQVTTEFSGSQQILTIRICKQRLRRSLVAI